MASMSRTKSREGNRAKLQQPHLLGLPLEIVLEIVQYLPPASGNALAYACLKFYNWRDAWLRDLKLFPIDRFDMLCMFERDRLLDTVVCGFCLTAHPRNMFSHEALKQPPNTRLCLATTPIIPLGRKHDISFRDAQKINVALRRLPQYRRFGWATDQLWQFADEAEQSIANGPHLIASKDRKGLGVLTKLNLCHVSDDCVPDKLRVWELLKGNDVQICRHLWLNDPRLVEMYDPKALFDQDGDALRRIKNNLFETANDEEVLSCDEEHCDSFAHWSRSSYYADQQQKGWWLQVVTFRYLGALRHPLDPQWMIHTPFWKSTEKS
ncbi:hypothetical protein PRK78_001912 [Emydomyces testavorans]|uniref:F-box domain-containing protein n=1 Tax=Emydomyces testavorans TaxID=2070801 RepID=A0AAF0DDW4_9EURO|nr:hypothetical protein PRK78_001912 [Emydomyces testavorans]